MAKGARDSTRVADVAIVGAGPAGASCAYWLAEAGWDVVVLEAKQLPREKTCGDGLTPRAIRQLADMDLASALGEHHRYTGLRACGFGRTMELPWPEVPGLPAYGITVTRHDLDAMVAERAAKAGATVRMRTEAVSPLMEPRPGGGLRAAGVRVRAHDGSPTTERRPGGTPAESDVRAHFVVVADGTNSRIGRALGAERDRGYPMGMAIRAYYRSPRHDEPWIESHLDIREPSGALIPGYGWIFPLGDGTVNVGAGLLNTGHRWKGYNLNRLMDAFVAQAPKSWGISPESAVGPATGGRLPMGLSVSPRAGPGWLAVGDAAGAINPFNGEGIAYGYETGRIAATVLDGALRVRHAEGADPVLEADRILARYERELDDRYRAYYAVARAFVIAIGHPRVYQALLAVGMRSERLMTAVLRVMANLLRPGGTGGAGTTEKALAAIEWMVVHGPDPVVRGARRER